MDAAHNPTTGAPQRRARAADGAVLLLTAGLAATAVLLLTVGEHRAVVLRDGHLPWWLFAIAFAAAERWSVHLEVRHEAYSFALSEVPLTVGLFYSTPRALVA